MSADVHMRTVYAYSDAALKGAIGSLERAGFDGYGGGWGNRRVSALKAELGRRESKRRGKECMP